ncbi:hypothetical protein D0Z70_15730 [Sphingobium terrigena]|uniref:Uncharacterized protein n=1 Tax=Sphingobium terrigena TaxID=2304063 RepID=A0A418YPX3_9SPHN|nr:hypothetical protein D0Z70_15730 [Sphingobium terrigena]
MKEAVIAKFVAMIGVLFALAGVFLNVSANLLYGRPFVFSAQCWSIAISVFAVAFGVTAVSLCFYSVRERTRRRR